MTLPKITFEDFTVKSTLPPREKWEYWHSNYLLAPRLFDKDIAKAEQLLHTMVHDIGLGNEGGKVLEGLKDKREVKTLRRWMGLQKAPAIIEMVKAELAANAYGKIVIFGMFRDTLIELRDGLKDDGAVLLFEGTPPEKRVRIIKRFQNDARCKVFCGHIPASAIAIDLTVAKEVLVVEGDWKDSMNPCAIMRCHNAHQLKEVRVRFAALQGTIDERIQRALKNRARIAVGDFQTDDVVSPFDD